MRWRRLLKRGQTDSVRVQAASSILDRNPHTSKHTKQTLERIGATDEDIARWNSDVDRAAQDLAVDADYEDITGSK